MNFVVNLWHSFSVKISWLGEQKTLRIQFIFATCEIIDIMFQSPDPEAFLIQADDFFVPAGKIWNITQVQAIVSTSHNLFHILQGFAQGTFQPLTWEVSFYQHGWDFTFNRPTPGNMITQFQGTPIVSFRKTSCYHFLEVLFLSLLFISIPHWMDGYAIKYGNSCHWIPFAEWKF